MICAIRKPRCLASWDKAIKSRDCDIYRLAGSTMGLQIARGAERKRSVSGNSNFALSLIHLRSLSYKFAFLLFSIFKKIVGAKKKTMPPNFVVRGKLNCKNFTDLEDHVCKTEQPILHIEKKTMCKMEKSFLHIRKKLMRKINQPILQIGPKQFGPDATIIFVNCEKSGVWNETHSVLQTPERCLRKIKKSDLPNEPTFARQQKTMCKTEQSILHNRKKIDAQNRPTDFKKQKETISIRYNN